MTCSHCESSVIRALLSLKEVESVQADYQSGEVMLEGSSYDVKKINQ